MGASVWDRTDRKAFASWLRSQVGKCFKSGLEWDVIQLVFTQYDGYPDWASTCESVRVVENKWGHPALEFFTSATHEYKPGEWVSASWVRCFERAMKPRARLFAAMRLAIEPQIQAFRIDIRRPVKCPLQDIALGPDAEVDHAPPHTFATLVDRFIEEHGEPRIGSVSSVRGPEFLDAGTREAWCAFHLNHAQLRWLSKEANRVAHLANL